MQSSRSPLGQIAEIAMRRFAVAVNRASEDSPIAHAKKRLGENYYAIACDALRRNLIAAAESEENERMVLEAPKGAPVGETIMAEIISNTLKDVIAAAGKEE